MNYRSNQVSAIRFQIFVMLMLCLNLGSFSSTAQDNAHGSWEIYVERDVDANGTDRLLFLNLLTGDITTAEVVGERFTPPNLLLELAENGGQFE